MVGRVRCPLPVAELSDGGVGEEMDRSAPEEEKGERGGKGESFLHSRAGYLTSSHPSLPTTRFLLMLIATVRSS